MDCYLALPPELELPESPEVELLESLAELDSDLAFLVTPSASEIRLPSLASGFCGLAGLVVFGAVVVAGFAEDATPVDELVPVEESSVEDEPSVDEPSVDEPSVEDEPSVDVVVSVDSVLTSAAAVLELVFAAADAAVGEVADLIAPSTSLTTVSIEAAAALAAPLSAAADGRLSEIEVEM
ncbi:hypothetical protein MHPYR_370017 [uncultured Mycobacterium sp.]|uniref:Uncharacterized protein n=1 Tax=uncultured Mycobacterium sp. TaxID=171292 RepID=A0A1Y5PDM5_9MYCO|nr:hypothetical protein MHPYR_370017 [uncultured Mycobacterium sp.]